MDQQETKRSKRPFTHPSSKENSISIWQVAILLLILTSFVVALIPSFEARSGSQLPPILFLEEDVQGSLQLYTASPPKWEPQQLTDETAVILNYAPSPDGSTQMAYAMSYCQTEAASSN